MKTRIERMPLILHVDTDDLFYKSLLHLFSMEIPGYRIVNMKSAKDALSFLQKTLGTEKAPSLIITEMALPDMNGLELARAATDLAVSLRCRRVPILFLSSLIRTVTCFTPIEQEKPDWFSNDLILKHRKDVDQHVQWLIRRRFADASLPKLKHISDLQLVVQTLARDLPEILSLGWIPNSLQV